MNTSPLDAAIGLHRSGRLDEARAAYEALVDTDPGNADALNLLGVLFAQQGNIEAAESLLTRAVEADPRHGRAYGSLGNLRRMQSRLDEAVAAYRRAAELDPDRVSNQFNLASALQATGDHDGAERHYRRALECDPDNTDTIVKLAVFLTDRERVDDAIETVEAALARQPDNGRLHEKLGDLWRHKNRFDKAADSFERALEAEPERRYLSHLVAAYRGEHVDADTESYVRFLFDNFADDYEERLAWVLDYRVPGLLRQALDAKIGDDARFEAGLDLGCGTGLSGKAFRDVVATLDGVDLSPRMLDIARKREIYDQLAERSVDEFLDDGDSRYDLFVAADLFVYFGDLAATFRRMRARAVDGALVFFSAENTNDGEYRLQRNGRFAHAGEYLDRVARDSGFQMLSREPACLRLEDGDPVTGHCCVMVAA